MIHYFTPYSLDHKFFDAYDYYASLVKNPNDWICFLDGDTAFLISDWGHVIQKYTEKYPNVGMLTSYASRCGYPSGVPKEGNQLNPNILFHKTIAEKLKEMYAGRCATKPYNRNVSGHLMCIKKSTWELIRKDVAARVKKHDKKILGVDTQISHALLAAGKNILLMRGVYLFHYFRLIEGRTNTNHLL